MCKKSIVFEKVYSHKLFLGCSIRVYFLKSLQNVCAKYTLCYTVIMQKTNFDWRV